MYNKCSVIHVERVKNDLARMTMEDYKTWPV